MNFADNDQQKAGISDIVVLGHVCGFLQLCGSVNNTSSFVSLTLSTSHPAWSHGSRWSVSTPHLLDPGVKKTQETRPLRPCPH